VGRPRRARPCKVSTSRRWGGGGSPREAVSNSGGYGARRRAWCPAGRRRGGGRVRLPLRGTRRGGLGWRGATRGGCPQATTNRRARHRRRIARRAAGGGAPLARRGRVHRAAPRAAGAGSRSDGPYRACNATRPAGAARNRRGAVGAPGGARAHRKNRWALRGAVGAAPHAMGRAWQRKGRGQLSSPRPLQEPRAAGQRPPLRCVWRWAGKGSLRGGTPAPRDPPTPVPRGCANAAPRHGGRSRLGRSGPSARRPVLAVLSGGRPREARRRRGVTHPTRMRIARCSTAPRLCEGAPTDPHAMPKTIVTAGRIPIRPHPKPIRIQNSDGWAFLTSVSAP